mmetsp:Transcript_221/g.573  ORF Transcript_221/g.573 Transcript_221/m.573 type:complete len:444 (-) Transcript_221:177-1508(-)
MPEGNLRSLGRGIARMLSSVLPSRDRARVRHCDSADEVEFFSVGTPEPAWCQAVTKYRAPDRRALPPVDSGSTADATTSGSLPTLAPVISIYSGRSSRDENFDTTSICSGLETTPSESPAGSEDDELSLGFTHSVFSEMLFRQITSRTCGTRLSVSEMSSEMASEVSSGEDCIAADISMNEDGLKVLSLDRGTQTTLHTTGRSFACSACSRPPKMPCATDGTWILAPPSRANERWLSRLTISGSLCTDAIGRVHRMELKNGKSSLCGRIVSALEGGLLAVSGTEVSETLVYELDLGQAWRAQGRESRGAVLATSAASASPSSSEAPGGRRPEKAEMGTQTDSVDIPACRCNCQDGGMHILDGVWVSNLDPSQAKARRKKAASMRISGLNVVLHTGFTQKLEFSKGVLELMGCLVLFAQEEGLMGLQCSHTGNMSMFTRLGDLR